MARALKLGAALALLAAVLVIVKLSMSTANGEARDKAQAEARLCAAKSERYFSCKTQKGKLIELCKQDQRVEYRFGTPAKLELAYPKADTDRPLRFASFSRAQTERAEVTFRVGGAAYAVFDYEEDGKQEAGVRATLASGKEVVFACVGPVQSKLWELKELLPCDADNALNLGGCPR